MSSSPSSSSSSPPSSPPTPLHSSSQRHAPSPSSSSSSPPKKRQATSSHGAGRWSNTNTTTTSSNNNEPLQSIAKKEAKFCDNHNNNNDNSNTAATAAAARNTTTTKIYCDLDGVLVDFNKGIYRLLRKDATKLYQTKHGIKRLWSAVDRTPKFFETLHWTKDGRELWQAIYHLQPDILTGVPNNKPDQIGRQKFRWCQRELFMMPACDDSQTTEIHEEGRATTIGGKRTAHIRGGGGGGGGGGCGSISIPKCNMVFNHVDMAARNPQRHDTVSGSKRVKKAVVPATTNCEDATTTPKEEEKEEEIIVINVISCWSRYKHHECTVPGSILIDDRQTLQTDWESAGGVFVHHVNTPTTLQKLRELGIPLKNTTIVSNKQRRRQQQHHTNKATTSTNRRHHHHHRHHRTTTTTGGDENHTTTAASSNSNNKSRDHHHHPNNNNSNSNNSSSNNHKRNGSWRNHRKTKQQNRSTLVVEN